MKLSVQTLAVLNEGLRLLNGGTHEIGDVGLRRRSKRLLA